MHKLTALVGLLLLLAAFGGVLLAKAGTPMHAEREQATEPAAAPLATPVCGPGAWTPRAPMPTSNIFNAVVAQGGQLFSFGGAGTSASYNPATDAWAPIAPPPATLIDSSAVSDGTYLYILNGSDSSMPHNTLYRYDPLSDSYTTLAAPPTATSEQAAVYLNGKIYRIAGSTGAMETTSIDVYTVSTDTWAPPGTVADYPLAVSGLNAIASGGYIYAGGGADQFEALVTNKTYRYDPVANIWDDTAVPDLPSGRYQGASDILNGYWILVGGFAWDYQVNTNVITLDLSNPAAGWVGQAWQPQWRWFVGGGTVGSAFYSVGGFDWAQHSQSDTARYTLAFCTPTPTGTRPTATPTGTIPPTSTPPACGSGVWTQRTPYPVPGGAGGSAVQGGRLYTFGGFGNDAPSADAYVYNPQGGAWTAIHPLPVALLGASAVSDGTYLYIAGGIDLGNHTPIAFYRYDPATNSYTTLAAAPIGAYDQGLAYLSGKIYRIGGSRAILGAQAIAQPGAFGSRHPDWTVLDEVDVYTISTGTWSTAAPYPQHAQGLVAVASGGYLYAGGGLNAGDKTYRYDPGADTWDDAAVTDLPEEHNEPASAILNGRWIIAGNSTSPSTGNIAVALDLTNPTGPWASLSPMPLGRGYPDGGAIGSTFFAVGGIGDPSVPTGTQSNQLYQEHYCPPPLTPTRTPKPISPTATRTASPPPGTPSPTGTASPSPTHIPTTAPSTPSGTPSASETPTRLPTGVPASPSSFPTGAPASPSPTVTACGVTFSDVHPTDYFYEPVTYLACRNVISGYADHTFRPYNNTTRAQQVKIVVLGFNRPLVTPAPGAYTFADVPPSQPFFAVIETLAATGGIGGYGCGGPGEACDDHHRPYFRPNAAVTRGQLSKIDVNAAGWPLLDPPNPTFSDVAPGSAFYQFVETAADHGVVSGYSDHTFRPNNPATRGQISKIVYLSITGSAR
jgi:N-acetylneuraminic acid mutarotase